MTKTKSNRLIAMLLAVMMVFTAVPMAVLTVNAAEEGNTTEFAGGSGTEADPYLISTKYHLDNVRLYMSSYFKMINDIEFTEADFSEDGEFYNYGACWTPIGNSTSMFKGNFDGNNHSIKNLKISKKNTDYIGLFGYVKDGNVTNVHLENADIVGKNYVGGICGYLHSTSVKNSSNMKPAKLISCYVSGEVTGNGDYTGGICGFMSGTESENYPFADARIQYCYNSANVNGKAYAGGITSYAETSGCGIYQCVNSGNVLALGSAGGIIGYIEGWQTDQWSSTITGTTYRYYYHYVYIENCINKGAVSAYESGGILGAAYAPTRSFNAVYGGLENSYNIGEITGTATGGILGTTIKKAPEGCFYLDTCVSDPTINYGTSTTAEDMKLIDTFSGWDFDSVWTMAGDKSYKYPELQCFTLKGEVALADTVAYLDEAKADITGVLNAHSDLTYEWYIDNALVHSGDTYSVKAEDIGKTLKVKATSQHVLSLGSLTSSERVITKAKQPESPTVPELLSLSDSSFEISTLSTQEYSIDNENWQASGVFENLDPNKAYTVYARILENDLYLLGESTIVLTATTERRALSGVVNISGTPQYGQTLSADVSGVLPLGATYSYEWRASATVVGTDSTYTVTKDDIGKGIILVIKGSGDYIGALSSNSVSASKATVQDPIPPVASDITNTAVELVEKAGYEYSLDKLNWQDSPLFEGLSAGTEYTFYQRAKETDVTFASKISDGTKITTLKNTVSAPEKPVAESVTNNSVTLQAISGYEYSMDGFTWQKSNVFTGLSPNTEYSFCQRKAENDTDYTSPQSEYAFITTLKNQIAAPDAPTLVSATDSVVTLSPISGYEYSLDGETWQTSNIFTGLTVLETYTFYQRVAETQTDYASSASESFSFKVKNIAPQTATPVLAEINNNTIRLEAVDGCEYSIDGENWTTSAVFENLSPNTTYSIYAITPETDTHYFGEISEALTVTTLKNTVDAPESPILSNRTNNSITLVANSGYEYSIDGTIWQTSNVFTGLSPNTEYSFYQRTAETHTDYASEKSDALKVYTLKNTVAAPAKPIVASVTSNSVILMKIFGYEYSIDGRTWQESNVFTGLSPNTQYFFYQRIAEAEISYASEKSEALTVTTLKNTVDAPAAPILSDRTNNSITLVANSGYEYSLNGTTWQTSNVFTGLSPNTEYSFYQRTAETHTDYASEKSGALKVTTLKNTVDAPEAPILSNRTNNSITLVANSGYEYSLNGTTWQTSNVFTGLSPNTEYSFYQRTAETHTDYASEKSDALTVTTLKNTVSAPEKPVVVNVANNSVTLQAINGYEYSMDGLTWQTSNVFTGLSPNTEYSFYQRTAETHADYASQKSDALKVTTLKNTVAAPEKPVVESVANNSVTLQTINGYEYSIDGTIWQTSNVFTGLSPNTEYSLYQRVAETQTSYASEKSECAFAVTPELVITVIGDVNGDGKVNSLDAAFVLKYDAMLIELDDKQTEAADVNGDGTVNSLDAAQILKFDAGLISEF